MIRIYLGKRTVGEYSDYQFLDIENNEIKYIAQTFDEKECTFFDKLTIGSIFIDNELLQDNPSYDQLHTINSALKGIHPIAEEFKKTYNPAEIISLDKKDFKISNVPSLSQFKNWKYIVASEMLNNFLFNHKYIQSNHSRKV